MTSWRKNHRRLGKANVKTPLAELEADAAQHVAELWPIFADFAEELHWRRGVDPVNAIDSSRPG
jgi:hypothetical protein